MVDYSKIHFWSYILNSSGAPIEDAEVRLYLNDDPTTEANIYDSETSSSYTTTSSVDIKTDNDGFFEFWIPDQWDDGGYEHSQLFRLEWYKAGTVPGLIENINPWPNVFTWENTNTGADKDNKNKFVSNYLVDKWLSHNNEIVPSASPHDLYVVDYSSCGNNRYNKLVSNAFLKNIIDLSSTLGTESLSGNSIVEYQEDITSWSPSGIDYYVDITHTLTSSKNVVVQASRLDNDSEYDLKEIRNIDTTTIRILNDVEVNLRINIQGN